MITNAVINTLPIVTQAVQIFITVIDDDNTFNTGSIETCKLLYGAAYIADTGILIPLNNEAVAIGINYTYDSNSYYTIFYTKAVYNNIKSNNYNNIVQKLPKGIFNNTSTNSIIGLISGAAATLLDKYEEYYSIVKQSVFSEIYTQQQEFQYNGTAGLLSNSIYADKLMLLFSSAKQYSLNVYDIELFISKYIYYRLGISCAVYAIDSVNNAVYWKLGVPGYTELGVTTILAPDNIIGAFNIEWVIYNSSDFTDEFKQELNKLIIRISRADVGNNITYSTISDPTDDDFTSVGYTYPNDPRLLYHRCIQYLGDDEFPLNILGFYKNT